MATAVSPKQLQFLQNSNARVNILEGAIRSGKTIIALLRWLMFVARAPKGGELLMIGRTRDSVWRNMIAPLQNTDLFGDLAKHVVGNYGAPTVKILGRVVHVMGASDAKAERVLRGMTVAGALVDEVTTIPEEFFTQLLGRMSVDGAQLFGTTNPDSPAHWLKKKFLDRIGALTNPLLDWTRWSFTIDDNPSLKPSYVEAIKNEFTGLWYRRFILGEWVAAEGAVFDFWNPNYHDAEDLPGQVIRWSQLPQMTRLFGVGIDYGTTHATSAIILGLGTDHRLYFVDEWRYEAGQAQLRMTDAQQSAAIRAWLDEDHLPYPSSLKPEWTIVDPAAASFKVQLAADGLNNIINADNDVLYGIRTMSSLMMAGKLLVSDRCPGIIQEFPGYSWDPKATERGEDKPLKVADDSIDPGRYVITTTETNWRPYVDLAA
ncbi:phage terminase large subunit [Arthrobacter sp. zg-Y859]|uniref:Phage terminase large subunit n=1 Tax=Arthrobacter jinronghuae TaxID=2964609 RepID=A0ABT1NV45_9MICC|nr:phage terminase large subunit [Arthrobacter jinronghuae]MCQ1951608.1 phage terminase large subunit [Arthrobacter jinronghuae]UWX79678.1 phage terminase large subunit [Arthrobacter jinronghuae]